LSPVRYVLGAVGYVSGAVDMVSRVNRCGANLQQLVLIYK